MTGPSRTTGKWLLSPTLHPPDAMQERVASTRKPGEERAASPEVPRSDCPATAAWEGRCPRNLGHLGALQRTGFLHGSASPGASQALRPPGGCLSPGGSPETALVLPQSCSHPAHRPSASQPGGKRSVLPAAHLQLGFALPGAPPHRVEIREFAILLGLPLSSGVGKAEEKTRVC